MSTPEEFRTTLKQIWDDPKLVAEIMKTDDKAEIKSLLGKAGIKTFDLSQVKGEIQPFLDKQVGIGHVSAGSELSAPPIHSAFIFAAAAAAAAS